MKKLSFILPCFNVENFIKSAFMSILSSCESCKWTVEDFEIIIVNDGSCDGTLNKIYEIQQSFIHYNIIVINQKNCGVSSARNAGIEVATGKWIWFIDPDDLLIGDGKSDLGGVLASHPDIDLLSFGYKLADAKNNTKIVVPFVLNENIINGKSRLLSQKELLKEYTPYLLGYSQENLDRLYKGQSISDKEIFVAGAVWHYLFRRDIIEKYKIRFNTNVILKEDALFVIDYMAIANKVLFVSDCWYKYRINANGGLAGN